MENISLSTNQLVKNYGHFRAVDHVSIHVREQDIYALIGRNGAGKSTLFKLITGLSHADEGSVSLFASQSPSQTQANLAHVGTMLDGGFYPYLNARENVEYFRLRKGIHDKSETTRVLDLVHMGEVKRPYKTYSTGMKQRVALAVALLGRPRLVILDEPTNGLDPQGIVEFRELIQQLRKDQGITFIISSHILSELSLLANRFGFIDHGVLVKEVDRDTLHRETRSVLIIDTNDNEQALSLLRNGFADQSFAQEDQLIVMNGDLDLAPAIARTLVNKNFQLRQLARKEQTLESYYLSLVGGDAQ